MSTLSKARGMTITKDDTRRMEDEARKMELKIEMLRKAMDGGDADRTGSASGDGCRWRSGTTKKPLRAGYVKEVLQTKPTHSSSSSGKQPRAAPGTSNSVPVAPSGSSRGSGKTTPRQQADDQASFASAVGGHSSGNEASSRAASNLQAALGRQSTEASEVEAFLADLGLDRYVSLFMEHGFDCMEVVNEMQESHMRDIGMAAGHALKLRKRLAELQPAPVVAPTPAAPAAGACSGSQKRVSFGEEATVRAPSEGTGIGTGGSLLDGHYDEEEAQSSFQEAVRAWREGRGADEGLPANAEASPCAPKAPGSFWSNVGGVEVNLERCSTPLSKPAEMQAETQHDPAPSEEKLCCYQCYKQFFAKYAVERASPLPDQMAKAEELQQRQEKLAKLEEIQRVMDYEIKASAETAGGA